MTRKPRDTANRKDLLSNLDPISVFAAEPPAGAIPVWLATPSEVTSGLPDLTADQTAWLKSISFTGAARRLALLPGPGGALAGAVLGTGERPTGLESPDTLVGLLPTLLPPGTYRLMAGLKGSHLAATAWGLGSYRFTRYKSAKAEALPRLQVAEAIDRQRLLDTVEAIWLGRDLINTPSNDMGPADLEAAAQALAKRHGAKIQSIVGDELLKRNFPLIHAVGRASPREPRLIDITAGRPGAPKVTIIGKGICFDTGGLDLKPSSAMLLMKKDMGGAATALALAHMILAAKIDVRLRVILAVAENSVAGNAFRPGDVLTSRAGKTVEIGNTDAEGRLVLADALALADEEAPDLVCTFATLTGAARVALGPDYPPYFCDNDDVCRGIEAAGNAVADRVWRLPLTTPYDGWIDSSIADMNNVSEGGFAGAIVGAIFLKRFVSKAKTFAHFDIYGWRPQPKPLGPKGGEPHAARTLFEYLSRTYGS